MRLAVLEVSILRQLRAPRRYQRQYWLQ
jgi:hypothetical protein